MTPAPRGERAAVAWSALYFFALLSGYYLLRPLREEMGIRGGVDKLPLLFTATFLAMLAAVPLWSWLLARVPRRRAIPWVNRFFALNLVAFWALLRAGVAPRDLARVFFVWMSVYNLFVVSVFWSFMADLFTREQGKRHFGRIAAGGSVGALAGPTATVLLARWIGPTHLLLVAAALLELSAICVGRLAPRAAAVTEPVGGGVLAGFRLVFRSPFLAGIAVMTLLFTTTSTFVYLQQARIVEAAISDSSVRTALFALIDLIVNGLSLLLQVAAVGPLMVRLGLGVALLALPALTLVGFGALALAPALLLIVVFQGVRRAAHYAIDRPAREVLFTTVGPEEKYKAKSFVDTVVYRGGDMGSAWLYQGLIALGLGVAGTAAIAVPLAAAWGAVAAAVARRARG